MLKLTNAIVRYMGIKYLTAVAVSFFIKRIVKDTISEGVTDALHPLDLVQND